MRLLFLDRKKQRIGVVPEVLDDLWVLERIVEPGDVVEADVVRRVKREEERGPGEVVKVHVRVSVESVEFHEYSGALRIKGRVVEARPERFVGKGKYQTVEVRRNEPLVLEKAEWSTFVEEELKRAVRETERPQVILVSMDDREAVVGILSLRLKVVGTVRNRAGKGDERYFSEYFGDVLAFVEKLEPTLVIVGGPGFVPRDFVAFASERGRKEYRFVRTSVSGEKGLYEILLSRLPGILEERQLERVERAKNELLKRLGKGEPVLLGESVKKAVEQGNVQLLLICEDLARTEEGRALVKSVSRFGDVLIVPKGSEAYAIIKKLGGMVAFPYYG